MKTFIYINVIINVKMSGGKTLIYNIGLGEQSD